MEFEDLFKILKFWKIFKNLKTFKSGGMRVKFKSIATVFALGFSGVSYLFFGGVNLEALELTPQDQPVLEACVTNHKRMNMDFQGNISTAAGCACTAKMVTASLEQDHYNDWAQAHALMLHSYQQAWSVKSEAQQKQFETTTAEMFSTLQKKSEMAPKRYSEMVVSLHEIDDVCDMEETYSEENIVKVASLRPIGYEVQLASQIIEHSPAGEVVELRLRGARAPVSVASK